MPQRDVNERHLFSVVKMRKEWFDPYVVSTGKGTSRYNLAYSHRLVDNIYPLATKNLAELEFTHKLDIKDLQVRSRAPS